MFVQAIIKSIIYGIQAQRKATYCEYISSKQQDASTTSHQYIIVIG
jgi:hypothetical protein